MHTRLGPGLLESGYQAVLAHELRQRGLSVQTKIVIPVVYDGIQVDKGFEADIIVESKLIVEQKSVEELHPVHKKQLLTYLRLTGLKLGLLINFSSPLLKNGIARVVNGLED